MATPDSESAADTAASTNKRRRIDFACNACRVHHNSTPEQLAHPNLTQAFPCVASTKNHYVDSNADQHWLYASSTKADGTRGRRIRDPPPPRPTPKSPSYAQIKELCAIWKFKDWRELPAEHFDRAETYFYDTSTGPWHSEASRRWLLNCTLLTAIENVIAALGFPGMGTAFGTKYTFTAHYTNDDRIPVLPERLHEIVMVEKSSLDDYTPE